MADTTTQEQKIDHEFTNNAVCPYCGYIDTDSWELGGGFGSEQSDDGETECGKCEREYRWHREIVITFSTERI